MCCMVGIDIDTLSVSLIIHISHWELSLSHGSDLLTNCQEIIILYIVNISNKTVQQFISPRVSLSHGSDLLTNCQEIIILYIVIISNKTVQQFTSPRVSSL